MSKVIFDEKSIKNEMLAEEDFYPIADDRFHDCGIDDIENGDNYTDYAEWFWYCYEDELF